MWSGSDSDSEVGTTILLPCDFDFDFDFDFETTTTCLACHLGILAHVSHAMSFHASAHADVHTHHTWCPSSSPSPSSFLSPSCPSMVPTACLLCASAHPGRGGEGTHGRLYAAIHDHPASTACSGWVRKWRNRAPRDANTAKHVRHVPCLGRYARQGHSSIVPVIPPAEPQHDKSRRPQCAQVCPLSLNPHTQHGMAGRKPQAASRKPQASLQPASSLKSLGTAWTRHASTHGTSPHVRTEKGAFFPTRAAMA